MLELYSSCSVFPIVTRDSHMTQTTAWRLPETSSAVPKPPPPAEASELDAKGDGEVLGRRPSPSIETEM